MISRNANKLTSAIAIGLLAILPPIVAAQDLPAGCDLPRGKDVYQMCSACHSLTAAESTREGPTLTKLFTRQAGSLTNFPFSPGMKKAGWQWSPALLESFLLNPRKSIRGTTMTFMGLKDAADRAAVACYIESATR